MMWTYSCDTWTMGDICENWTLHGSTITPGLESTMKWGRAGVVQYRVLLAFVTEELFRFLRPTRLWQRWGLMELIVNWILITPFTLQLVWWDEKAIYIEQQFITLGDNFVRAIAMSKQSLTKVNVMDVMKKFTGGESRPECPKELQLWLESSQVCSDKLRKEK